MTQIKNSNRNFRTLAATAMLIIGSAVQITYSGALAWQFHATLSSTAADCLGLLGNVGLASLRVVHTVTLDHAAVLSVLRHILILFSAFLVMLAGIALLPKRASNVSAPAGRNLSAPARGAQ
jgi:hypothetical protein